MVMAKAVIGANYGDEGKGLLTDYLARETATRGLVVRYNGGAQAGHTVVTPDGLRHIFHHFGSGTLAGWDTHLSRFFITNPFLWAQEQHELGPRVSELFIDPLSPVTTHYDMVLNQIAEQARGDARHGSCGVGIHETMVRSEIPEFQILAGDLMSTELLEAKLRHIAEEWVPARLKQVSDNPKDEQLFALRDPWLVRQFIQNSIWLMRCSHIVTRPTGYTEIIFEGAQGLLLDPDYGQFPYVTHSHTGLKNVITLAREWRIERVDPIYVTRSYLTRHGAGPLPGEAEWGFKDDTNLPHPFQGTLRHAALDIDSLYRRLRAEAKLIKEAKDIDFSNVEVAVTHLDQQLCPIELIEPKYASYGPRAGDVQELL